MNDERLSGENLGVVGPLCLVFGILKMLFDLQHVVSGDDERGEKVKDGV